MITVREEIRSNYPETLSLENIRCILRISKRKTALMLQNGIIKCEISEKKTLRTVKTQSGVITTKT